MNTIQCPTCSNRWRVPPKKLGQDINCPCGTRFNSRTGVAVGEDFEQIESVHRLEKKENHHKLDSDGIAADPRQIACPSCTSENVQSLQMIHAGGTTRTNTTGVGFAFSGAEHGGTSLLVGGASGTHQTKAAQQAAPPKREDTGGPIAAIFLGVAAGLLALLFVVLSVREIGTYGFAEGWLLLLISAFAALFSVVALKFGISNYNKARTFNAEKLPQLYDQWLRTFMCLECGRMFKRQ